MKSKLAHYQKWFGVGVLLFIVGAINIGWALVVADPHQPSLVEIAALLIGLFFAIIGFFLMVSNLIDIREVKK
ncbi:hypothetical protein M1545_02955 [Patescibacteria group bacterium]|nr:hypothetical protein [Patescibacteria group bacterium]